MRNGPDFTLIVLGGSLTALAVVRNAAAMGCSIILIATANEPALDSSLPREKIEVESETEALSAIDRPYVGSGPVALLATSDSWVRFVVEVREELERLGLLVLQAANKAVNTCLDKNSFERWALGNDLPVPSRIELPSAEAGYNPGDLQDLPYPLIVRPTQSVHGAARKSIDKARFIHSTDELMETLNDFRIAGSEPAITQSLIPFDPIQYSVCIVRSKAGMRSFVTEKVRPSAKFASVGCHVKMTADPEVEALGRTVMDKLDYFGMAEIEILKRSDNDSLYLIEVNARPWLQYNIAWRSGHNFLGFLLDANSYRADKECKSGYAWIDFNSDFFTAFSSSMGMVRQRHISLPAYLASVLRCNVYARFSWGDIRPFYSGLRELQQLITGRTD